jgi:uncharacterized protein DUF5681
MTEQDSASPGRSERALADEKPVGYGRPPKATRFKPGQSGNPKGRPKGSRNLSSELMELFLGKVAVSDGGRRRYVTRLTAVLLTQWQRAVKGDERATQAHIAFAKALGLFDKSESIEPSQRWTDEMLRQLSDEELEQIIRLDEKREALLSSCAPAKRPRTH